MKEFWICIGLGLLAALGSLLLIVVGASGQENVIESHCKRYGAFYIDDQRYNCEVKK